ncbi:MAG: AfsR/SARP family transcriptional regulator, partial [Candidatus Eisenbacteria bacterium]|nr:AfsR/SARP family transcriptional regulator [Candidatus Eisenbacteria bacterium]
DACAELVEALLASSRLLHVLVTSREPLFVSGEMVWPLPPLGEDPKLLHRASRGDLAAVRQNEAVQLFIERARAVRPDFALGLTNAAAVVQLCARLDGIPLAIELAAARVRHMPPEQILLRLDDRLRLLSATGRGSNPRQQTLQATIDWSIDLLSHAERALFERLAVFRGGWTLDAAESVCSGDGIEPSDVLDLLGRL